MYGVAPASRTPHVLPLGVPMAIPCGIPVQSQIPVEGKLLLVEFESQTPQSSKIAFPPHTPEQS